MWHCLLQTGRERDAKGGWTGVPILWVWGSHDGIQASVGGASSRGMPNMKIHQTAAKHSMPSPASWAIVAAYQGPRKCLAVRR